VCLEADLSGGIAREPPAGRGLAHASATKQREAHAGARFVRPETTSVGQTPRDGSVG
jgi:hypothetical protein